jgi:hypothetical protein
MVGSGNVPMAVISACIAIRYHQGKTSISLDTPVRNEFGNWKLTSSSFVLKTKEQRAAEKALMDKSPMATLTMEDFLESERHKLTGKLTPVTPETFAKWKKERLDKKQAEEQAKQMKEATGRALFEKGGWEDSDEDDEDEDRGAWNLEALRRETEEARMKKEEDRLAALSGDGDAGGTGGA